MERGSKCLSWKGQSLQSPQKHGAGWSQQALDPKGCYFFYIRKEHILEEQPWKEAVGRLTPGAAPAASPVPLPATACWPPPPWLLPTLFSPRSKGNSEEKVQVVKAQTLCQLLCISHMLRTLGTVGPSDSTLLCYDDSIKGERQWLPRAFWKAVELGAYSHRESPQV